MVKFTSYINGTVRNANGKLVAYYDEATKRLYVDGVKETLTAMDIEHAMDLVSERLNKK